MKKLMIIDGSSLLFRAFFALPPLKNALGLPTNAVYGFLTMLLKLYEELNPDYVAVAFDKSRETFRTELYSEYKANRDSAPDDLQPQFALIIEVLSVLGIHAIELDGFEGDDILGSLAAQYGSSEMKVSIVSGDRDTLQLIDANASVFLTKKGISEMIQVTADNMEELYGYGPEKVIEMKALMGDSSDNIPGVPGVGEKTALKLITQYGNLETLYDSIDEIKGKLKEKLVDHKDKAYLSRTLATIKRDIPCEYEETFFVPVLHEQEMIDVFNKLGFQRLIARFQKIFATLFSHDTDERNESVDENSNAALCSEGTVIPAEFVKNNTISVAWQSEGKVPFLTWVDGYVYNGTELFHYVGNDMEALVTTLNLADEVIAMDVKSLLHLTGVQTAKKLQLFKLDEGASEEQGLVQDDLFSSLNSPNNLTSNTAVDINLENSKQPRVFDLMLISYLLDPTRTNYGISYLCERFETVVSSNGSALNELADSAVALHKMAGAAKKEISEAGVSSLYASIELPLIETLAVMEKNGIFPERATLLSIKTRFDVEIDELQKNIYELAGEEFNINSPKQLGVILFEKLGLPVIKKTKTGFSTDAEVLDILRADHPVVEKVLAYRTVAKLVSTYLVGLEALINPVTNRVHTTFNQMVTATGRLSSSDPNLQNIPVRTEKGREIRSIFKPGTAYDFLLSADYSQIELRVLAHLAEDPGLMKAFAEGMDIHRFTAAEVLGKSPEAVTGEERSHAKAVNFGIIYGISDFGLARDLGISREAAKAYIETYFQRYPSVKGFMDHYIEEARVTGEVRTLFNRLRPLPDINNRNFNRRSFAERTAMNTPIQGTAADIIKLAMNRVEKRLQEEKFSSRLLLQVHDELVIEGVTGELEALTVLVREEMENVVTLRVPLVVDVHTGTDWSQLK